MSVRLLAVELPCACIAAVEIDETTEVGIALVACTDVACTDVRAGAGPFIVSWRHVVATTVVPLEVPVIAPAAGVVLQGPPILELDQEPPIDPARAAADGVDLPRGERQLEPGDVLTSPKTDAEWKVDIRQRDLPHSHFLVRVRELAKHHGRKVPRDLNDIDEVLTPLVEEWLNANHPIKPEAHPVRQAAK